MGDPPAPADSESRRKLAAIVSADALGYSRLMQADEPATVATLQAYRGAMRRVIERHKGRVVNAPGDALLAEFASVVEAVAAAVEIQQNLEGRNMELAPERRMQFRIGVNLGDVIELDDGTIYGDGVNIAARIEALAEGGGVCVSAAVFDAVEGKLALGFDYLGEQQVKNIAKPVRVYRVRSGKAVAKGAAKAAAPRKWLWPAVAGVVLVGTIAALGLWRQRDLGGQAPEDPVLALPKGPSIAVLPFTDLGGDPKEEYFADGISEEIITQLTRFRELFVIARNSTFRYKGRPSDVRQIGRDLRVRYVLEGSVRKGPDRIRVTAQLIDAGSGAHLWAQTYDRNLSTAGDVFGVQDEITQAVVAQIADEYGVISRAGVKETRSKATDSLAAYQCVLHARNYYEVTTAEAHLQARDCLERVTVLDPNYSDAWAWLAAIYRDELVLSFNRRRDREPLDRALEAAQRAVALDRASAMAHYSLASVHFFRHELEQFLQEADQALALNPNNTLVLADFGNFLINIGQLERGLALTKKAMALNPHHPTWYYANLSLYHYQRHQDAEALAAAQKWNQPGFWWNQVHLAQAYAQLGRTREAQAAVAELLRLYPGFPGKARMEFRTWNTNEETVARQLDGLRKAGLQVPPE